STKPVISLPEAVTVMEGEKRTLMCEITGFYPEQLTVTWLIQNGSQLSRGVCTGMATPNPDGTYSVSSLITVQATATESSGVVYVFPPTVSEIIKPAIVYAMRPTVLKCTIKSVPRIKELKVKWFRVLANGEFAAASDSQSKALLSPEELSDQANLHFEGRFHVSTLTILNPTFLQISSIPQIPQVGRSLVLCCRVEKFYPEKVALEWSRNDGEQVSSITNYGPFSDDESMYSMWSKIKLVMAVEDERAVYTCRVYHSSFPLAGYRDVLYHINSQGD
uniref:Ig-like domain-containing protein n=1 Tax=Esox lucius TaxID=8010 RepID=A0AAY5KV28_ESOLU